MHPIADLLGAPHEIRFEGKLYKVRPPNQIEQAMFTRWLEQRDRENAARANELKPDQQDKLFRLSGVNAATCAYEWGSDAYVAALATPYGTAKMLSLVMAAENPGEDITEEFVLRFVAQSIAEIAVVKLAEVTDDPKARAALLASAGLPPDYLDSRGSSSSPS